MNIDITLINKARELIRKDKSLLYKNYQELKTYISENTSETEIEMLTDIVLIFQDVYSVQDIQDVNYINKLLANKRYISKTSSYFGYILTEEKQFNPIYYFSKISDQKVFWSYYRAFNNSFEIAPKSNIEYLEKCVANCLKHTDNSTYSLFFSCFNKYLLKYPEQNDELFENIIKAQTNDGHAIFPLLVENMYKRSWELSDNAIILLFDSNSEDLEVMACFICEVMLRNFPNEFAKYQDYVQKAMAKYPDSDACLQHALGFQLLILSNCKDSQKAIEMQEMLPKYLKGRTLASEYLLDFLYRHYDLFKLSFSKAVEVIFSQIPSGNDNLHIYDSYLALLIEKDEMLFAYNLLKVYFRNHYTKDKRLSVRNNFRMSIHELTTKFANDFIDCIYKDLLVRDSITINFAIDLLHEENLQNNMLKGDLPKWLTLSDALQIMKLLTVSILIHVKFVTAMALKLLECEDGDDFEQYTEFYLSEICENYLDYSTATIKNHPNPNIKQQRLIQLADEYVEKQKCLRRLAFEVKDFQPSSYRDYLYRIERDKRDREIIKEGEKHSVILSLVTRSVFKYGRRHAHVVDENGLKKCEEHDYARFEQSFPLPTKYINDPVHYRDQRDSILGREAVHDESCS